MEGVLFARAADAAAFLLDDTALFLVERAAAAAGGAAVEPGVAEPGDALLPRAHEPAAHPALLLAHCQYRQGNVRAAHHTLAQHATLKSVRMRYLFARCCLDLDLCREGETALREVQFDPALLVDKALLAASLCLLGLLCRKAGRKPQAVSYFRQSLQLNPFLWSAVDGLCQLGDDFKPADFFGELTPVPPPPPAVTSSAEDVENAARTPLGAPKRAPIRQLAISDNYVAAPSAEPLAVPFTPSPQTALAAARPAAPAAIVPPAETPGPAAPQLDVMDVDTPHVAGAPSQLRFSTPSPHPQRAQLPPPPALARRAPPARTVGSAAAASASATSSRSAGHALARGPAGTPGAAATAATPSESLRRSTRLLQAELATGATSPESAARPEPPNAPARPTAASASAAAAAAAAAAVRTNARTARLPAPGGATTTTPVAPRPSAVPTAAAAAAARARRGGAQGQAEPSRAKPNGTGTGGGGGGGVERERALRLVHVCALVQLHVSQYRCREALAALEELPGAQRNTAWALSLEGRAHYELVAYDKAERCLDRAFRLEPHRSRGLVDIYSNVLWQLHKDVQLSFLAHTVEQTSAKAPETWVAVGNCFSLQKDHEAALRCFQRSLQLDPGYAYAYTLSGWEYVEHDDFDKAVACFRNAIRVDPRHYSAWYWLGVIFNHQEKYDMAEFHFRQALAINPASAMVWCHLGMVLGTLKRTSEAFEVFRRAEQLDPRNPLVKFRRARVHISLGQLESAARDLEQTAEQAPREAHVFRMLADLYKKLNRPADAVRAQTTAHALDPKGASGAASLSTDDLNDDLEPIGSAAAAASPGGRSSLSPSPSR